VEIFVLLAVGASVLAAFLAESGVKARKKSKPYRRWFAGCVAAAVVSVGFGVLAVVVNDTLEAEETQRQEEFTKVMKPVAAELERLGLKPGYYGFQDMNAYRLNEDMVAIQNTEGDHIWVGYEVKDGHAVVGCFLNGKVYPTTPAGAIQLAATKGCATP